MNDMQRLCAYCEKEPLPQPSRGPQRQYCSPKCRQGAYRERKRTSAVTDPSRGVYRERAHLLAHLAAIYPSHFQSDPAEPDWPVLFISLPTGQACWHIAPDDLDLFPHVAPGGDTWDGHTTELKYRRLDHATRIKAAGQWVA
jgi:hypothetical protein